MKIKKFQIKNLFFIALAAVYFIENNPTIKANTHVRYIFILIIAGYAVSEILIKGKLKLNTFYIWTVAVLFFFTLSSRWSFNTQDSFQNVKNMLIVYVILLSIITVVKMENDFLLLLKYVVWAFVADTLYVLMAVGLNDLGEGRLGAEYSQLEEWNANAIAGFTAWGCIIAIYLFLNAKRKIEKRRWGIIALFFAVMTMYTGSRKGIIIIVAVPLCYSIYAYRGNKKIRNTYFVILAMVVGYILIMYNQQMYELIGARIVRMIQELLGHKTSENSMSIRMLMISSGFFWFLEHPLLGYGIGQYHILLSRAIGLDTYSHCNFVEILVGGGIIGFLIYYSIYIELIILYINKILKTQNKTVVYFFFMLVISTVLHAALVCYSDLNYITVLLLAYIVAMQNISGNISKK